MDAVADGVGGGGIGADFLQVGDQGVLAGSQLGEFLVQPGGVFGDAGGLVGVGGGQLGGEQGGAVGAGEPFVDELADHGAQVVFADGDGGGVVGAGGQVAGVGGVVGAEVVGACG